MKTFLLSVACVLTITLNVTAQGEFAACNRVPTRIGSIDGPLAGPSHWGQFFVGRTPDSLSPVAAPRPHDDSVVEGVVSCLIVEVDGILGGERAFVQMAAWDGAVWGIAFAEVPENQLGWTDVVSVKLTIPLEPDAPPPFTQPAIIPPVPEPSTLALGLVALGVSAVARRLRRRRPSG